MSYAKNQRRKSIRRFKKEFGEKWQPPFRKHVDEIRSKKDGPFIGTLQEIMDRQRRIYVK